MRVAAAPAVPDLTSPILAAIGAEQEAETAGTSRDLFPRLLLASIGVLQLVLSVPALVLGEDAGLPVHTARHLGSFGVALAVGFLYVAWKPARVQGLLLVLTALVACLIGTSIADVMGGTTPALTEGQHLAEVVGVAAMWLLAHPSTLRAATYRAFVSRGRSKLRALLAVAAVAAALVVLLPTPASAHASLVSTDPGSGQVVDSPPKAITLRFNESVQILPSGIRLYDSRGDRVDIGAAEHPDGKGDEVRSSVPRLENGTYVVTWRVVSSDAHPVRASFVFTVGTGVPPSQLDDLVNRLLDEQGGSTATGVAYGITRGVVFGGLTLLIGGAAFLVMVWPAGRDSKRARGIVWAAWGLTFVFTLLAIGLEGAYTDALPLGDAFSPSTIGDVLDTRYGRVMLLRLALLLLALPLLRLLLQRRPSAEYPLARWWAPVAGVLGIGLLLTPGLAGHASTGRWVALAIPTDVVHLGGVALWLGGLVLLALAVLPRSSVEELREVLPRYSRQAFWCIALIIVSGGLQAWRQIGSLSELRDTDYGRILVVKLLVFGGLVIVAAFSREIVNRTFRAPREAQPTTGTRVLAGAGGPSVEEPPGPSAEDPGDGYADYDEYDEYDFEEEYDEDSERRRLKWSVLLEVGMAIAILGVTALLVNAAPARTAPVDGIAQVTMKSPTVWVDVEATPGRAGTNEVHVTALDPNGTLTNVDDITMRASLPDRDVAPIDVELRDLGPGHYVANTLTFPFPGKWRLEAQVTVTGNEVEALAGTLDIG